MKTMTHDEFRSAIRAQAETPQQVVFKCPRCETLQSGEDLIAAGAGDWETVRVRVGFSCIGRFTGKGSPSKEIGKGHGCNWTLGGLFQMHQLEVITPDGERHPMFELATPDVAARHRARQGGVE